MMADYVRKKTEEVLYGEYGLLEHLLFLFYCWWYTLVQLFSDQLWCLRERDRQTQTDRQTDRQIFLGACLYNCMEVCPGTWENPSSLICIQMSVSTTKTYRQTDSLQHLPKSWLSNQPSYFQHSVVNCWHVLCCWQLYTLGEESKLGACDDWALSGFVHCLVWGYCCCFWLRNIQATCLCISVVLYVLSYWDRSFRSVFLSHPVTV